MKPRLWFFGRLLALAVLCLAIPAQAFAAWSFPRFSLRLPPGVTGSVGEMAAEGIAADGAGGITLSGVVSAVTSLGPLAFTNPYTASVAVVAAAMGAWYSADPAGFTAYMQSVGAVLSGLTPSSAGYGVPATTYSMTATCPDGSAVWVGGPGGTVESNFLLGLGVLYPKQGSSIQDVVWNRVSDQVLINVLRGDGGSTVTGYKTLCASGADPTYTGVVPTPPPTVPATPAQVQSAAQNWLAANPAQAPAVAAAAAGAGYPPALSPPAGAVAGGPSTVSGPTTTTSSTAADGTKSVATCTPTYQVTYGQASAALTGGNSCTTVTTPVSGASSTSTSVTSTTAASAPVGSASAASSAPFVSPATQFPSSSAPPAGVVALPSVSVPSTAGTCPAPLTFSVYSTSYPIDLTPLCTLASEVRPFVIGVNGLAAVLFILRGI